MADGTLTMTQRHRYATVPELVELLASASHDGYRAGKAATGTTSRLTESGEEVMVPFEQLSEASKDISRAAAAAMLDALARHGVDVGALVKIAHQAEPVNQTERPEDTVRRFADQLEYAHALLNSGYRLTEDIRTAPDLQAWRDLVALFPHKPEDIQP